MVGSKTKGPPMPVVRAVERVEAVSADEKMPSTAGDAVTRFDPHDIATLLDPYSVYARYREMDPVHSRLMVSG
ncbi:hypothetical protein OG874_22150 [Nocardia sp. NBC_00565]|uniref:hypothetical protein n=1 Tax=Nocardia sp. NBC_00565 TaxID=2975993 RepID=UPI002E7FB602|nr:hypothetical protein [Nocardia sp. NBC_00565]WUC07620.1 hypothetical protein OG874_22150 [Nocardia sp. NBC_00565]